jgi:hypothetical protein
MHVESDIVGNATPNKATRAAIFDVAIKTIEVGVVRLRNDDAAIPKMDGIEENG